MIGLLDFWGTWDRCMSDLVAKVKDLLRKRPIVTNNRLITDYSSSQREISCLDVWFECLSNFLIFIGNFNENNQNLCNSIRQFERIAYTWYKANESFLYASEKCRITATSALVKKISRSKIIIIIICYLQ